MTSNHHALYDLGYTRTTMALNKEKQDREVEQNSETTSQFGLQAATRLHEVGIASNRGSACHGEYVPGSFHNYIFIKGITINFINIKKSQLFIDFVYKSYYKEAVLAAEKKLFKRIIFDIKILKI